jgi:hypothetical protein
MNIDRKKRFQLTPLGMSLFADCVCRSRPALNTFGDLGRGITCISKRCRGKKEAVFKVTRREGQGKLVFLIVSLVIQFQMI